MYTASSFEPGAKLFQMVHLVSKGFKCSIRCQMPHQASNGSKWFMGCLGGEGGKPDGIVRVEARRGANS
jgi:hypothetical protein